jgi:epsilon-lactone hydrolase
MPAHLSAPDHECMGEDPVLYQIRVNGHLGPILLTAFPGLVSQQQGAETVLTGLLPDAAALYGVLAQVEALGLDLIEVRKVRPGTSTG